MVALESTIISHGLPRPDNLRVARAVEAAVRAQGAVPATIAVCEGRAHVGLNEALLEQVAARDDVVKASLQDLGPVLARTGQHASGWAATTVAATAALALQAGISVFATGGLGGVHRGASETFDESADLTTLGRTPIVVVCAGMKSILDVPATLERLETLNVCVLGYRTESFAGFYLSESGYGVPGSVASPAELAAVVAARISLGLHREAVILANPLPTDRQVPRGLHDRVLLAALSAAAEAGVSGKDVTPFVLDYFHHNSDGESLRANEEIIIANATLAAQVAVAMTQPPALDPRASR